MKALNAPAACAAAGMLTFRLDSIISSAVIVVSNSPSATAFGMAFCTSRALIAASTKARIAMMAAISVSAAIAPVEMPLTLSMTSSETANVAIRSDSATALVMAF